MLDIQVNEVIGSYRILRPLGQGGMGAVFEVEHVKLGVHYALKAYTLEDDGAELFRKKFAAFLDVAYVLHVKDVAEKDGVLHLPIYMAPLIVAGANRGTERK